MSLSFSEFNSHTFRVPFCDSTKFDRDTFPSPVYSMSCWVSLGYPQVLANFIFVIHSPPLEPYHCTVPLAFSTILGYTLLDINCHRVVECRMHSSFTALGLRSRRQGCILLCKSIAKITDAPFPRPFGATGNAAQNFMRS